MSQRPPTIAALGGGGFMMADAVSGATRMDRWLLSLTGVERPRVCFIPTASGDSQSNIAKFTAAYGALPCEPSVLSLFRRTIPDVRAHLMAQDLVFVGGGNTAPGMISSDVSEALEAGYSGRGAAGVRRTSGSVCVFRRIPHAELGHWRRSWPNNGWHSWRCERGRHWRQLHRRCRCFCGGGGDGDGWLRRSA